MEKNGGVPRPIEELEVLEYKTYCPLMTKDRLGFVTCFYRFWLVGACDPERCEYYQREVKKR